MIKYDVVGKKKGKVLIFITGAGVSSWMWKYQEEYFRHFKCIFLDLPGHGQNSNLDFTTIEDVADMVKKIIIEESKDNQAVLIGHSIGAQIIMYMIKTNSEFIEKAVIVSGLNFKMTGINWMLKPMVASTMSLIKWRSFAKAQAKELSLPEDMFEKYYKDSLKISKVTLLNILSENMNFEFLSTKNEVEVLILVGENEKKIMKRSAAKTLGLMKTSKAYIIRNASHGIPFEQPELFNTMISSFIEDKEIVNDGLQLLKI